MTPPHVVKEGGREGTDEMFDSIVRELQTSRFSHDKMTFPLRYLKLPSRPVSHSKRLRSRWRAKEILAKLANRIIDVLNSMYRYTRAPDFRAGVERATEGTFEARLLKLVKPLRRELGRVPTARGAVQELFKSELGYGSRKDRQVWLCDENVELVAEPRDQNFISMEDCDADFLAQYVMPLNSGAEEEAAPACLKPGGRDGAPPHRHSHFVGGTRTAYRKYISLYRDSGSFTFLYRSEVKCVNGIFFVLKSNNVNLRRILACVPANECFVSTPPCDLPGPWVLGRIERTGPLWFGQADVQAAFYRVALLAWLIAYFAAPAVYARDIMSDEELRVGGFRDVHSGRWLSASDRIYPSSTRLPMGFSHAVAIMLHLGTQIAFRTMRKERKLLSLNRRSSEMGPLVLESDQVAAGLFVDNLIVIANTRDEVNMQLSAAVGDLNDAGLTVGEVQAAARETVFVGLEMNQIGMQPKSRQLALLREATRYFASFRFLSGVVLEKLMGYYSWFFSLERLLFSLTGATYLFIETAGESWIPLWISVKHELLQLCDILPLARADWGWSRSTFVVAQDAEGPNDWDHGGCGVVVAPLTAADWRWGVENLPRVPRSLSAQEEQFILARSWTEVSAVRWLFREHINFGELEAVIEWVKQLCGTGLISHCRILCVSDSGVVVGVVKKGRSPSFWLRSRLKKLAALLLRADLRLTVCWIPTDLMPADGASRRRGRRLVGL